MGISAAMSNAIHQAKQSADKANATQSAPKVVLSHVIAGILFSILFTVIFVRVFDQVSDAGHKILPFDFILLQWMYQHRAPVPNAAAIFLAHSGSPPVIVGIALGGALVGILWRKVRGAAWTLPIAVVGSGLIIQGIKLLVQRPRPQAVPHGFQPLLHETGFSFPSGHSLIAMVVYGLLGYFVLHLFKNRAARLLVRVVTVLVVFSIGASRVYVGVHYPTDVLAGWTAGVPWLVACLGLHEVLARRWPSTGEPVLTPQADKAGDQKSGESAVKTLLKG